MLFLGIPPVNANATNTVALWPGQVASIGAYRRQFRKLSRKTMMPLLITALLGAAFLASGTLLKTPQTTSLRLVPWLILVSTLIFMMSRRVTRWVRSRTARHQQHELSRFTSGISAPGEGILILPMLTLLGTDEIHTMNTLKTLLTTISNGGAMLLFIVSHALY